GCCALAPATRTPRAAKVWAVGAQSPDLGGGYIATVATFDDDLRLAHVLADAVERTTMSRFLAEDLVVRTKPDLTLVSDADRAVEELIRGQLARTRPRDAVTGEEEGTTGRGPRRWVIDPI